VVPGSICLILEESFLEVPSPLASKLPRATMRCDLEHAWARERHATAENTRTI